MVSYGTYNSMYSAVRTVVFNTVRQVRLLCLRAAFKLVYRRIPQKVMPDVEEQLRDVISSSKAPVHTSHPFFFRL